MKVNGLALPCATSKPWGISTKGYSASVPAKITNVKDEGLMRYACDQDLGILFWEFCSMSGGFAELERHTEQQNASQKKYDTISLSLSALFSRLSYRVELLHSSSFSGTLH